MEGKADGKPANKRPRRTVTARPASPRRSCRWEAVTLFRYIYDPDMPQSESPKPLFRPVKTLARLKEAFKDSKLPIQADVLDWQEISQSFKEVIPKDYAVLQKMLAGSGGRVARR